MIERAVRMVFEAKDQYRPQWAVIESSAGNIGCTAGTLRRGLRHAAAGDASRRARSGSAHAPADLLARERRPAPAQALRVFAHEVG
ncbi:MAG: hypothetical protein GX886_00320, partial [Comamonadaceae bacterium]|nr:hypothetical protein [Comamonadaceae bacterium]